MPRKPSNPVTDQERERVKQLHAEGLGRNAIAAELGRPTGTVTNIARQLGLDFDRTATEAAVKARKIDLAEKRGLLREKFLNRADELLNRAAEPYLVHNFGGKDNTYAEHQLDLPPAAEARNLTQAAATAATAEIRISQADNDHGLESVRSMLGNLGSALGLVGPDDDPAD